jgi:hypothetical protein
LFKLSLRRGVLAALAIALLSGGVAYATSSGDTTIKACAKTQNGQLRLDTGDGCLSSEQALTWNQTGPQGPAGPQGPQGPAGITHVDERYFYRGGANVPNWLPIVTGVWPDVKTSMTRVMTMHFTPGTYLVSATIIAENDAGQGIVVCLFGNPSYGYGLIGQSAVGWRPGFSLQQTFGTTTTYEFAAPTDMDVRCFNAPPNQDSAGNPKVGLADMVATKIDSATVTEEKQ